MKPFLVFSALFLFFHLSAQIVTSEIEVVTTDSTTIKDMLHLKGHFRMSGEGKIFIDTKHYGEKVMTRTTPNNQWEIITFEDEFQYLRADCDEASFHVEMRVVVVNLNDWNGHSLVTHGIRNKGYNCTWVAYEALNLKSHSGRPRITEYSWTGETFKYKVTGNTNAVIHIKAYAITNNAYLSEN